MKTYYTNNKIFGNQVRLIHDGETKVVNKIDAIRQARDLNLDLVQIAKDASLPICKILDFGKFKYDLSKREKEKKKQQKALTIPTKEIKLKFGIGPNDLLVKAKQALKFLKGGKKVKVFVSLHKIKRSEQKFFEGKKLANEFVSYMQDSQEDNIIHSQKIEINAPRNEVVILLD